MEGDLDKTWGSVLQNIEQQVSRPAFRTWFSQTKLISKSESTIKIGVPSNFIKEWLQNKFHYLLLREAKRFLDDARTIEYILLDSAASELQRAPRSRQAPKAKEYLEIFYVDPNTGLNQKYQLGNFVVGGNNELAFAAAQAVIKTPGTAYNPYFVYGGTGLGKTHLLQGIGNEISRLHPGKRVKYITCERFIQELLASLKNQDFMSFKTKFKDIDFLILDDIHFLSGKERAQYELFHIFNQFHEEGKQIVFSSDRPPQAIDDIQARLRSRLEGGVVLDITLPDFETRLAILTMKTREKNLDISGDILEIIARRVQRNVRELEGILNKVAVHFFRGRDLPLEEIDLLIKRYYQSGYRTVTPQRVIQIVAEFYEIPETAILRQSRQRQLTKIRQVAMHLLREITKLSYPVIGERLGNRDHTTIMYGCEKIAKQLAINPQLIQEVEALKLRILGE